MRTITLGDGKRVSLTAYIAEIKRVKADAPGTRYNRTLCCWYPGTREDVLREFRESVEDRINRHMVIRPEPTPRRMYKIMAARIKHVCRWCGVDLGEYRAEHARFCSPGCRSAHSGW